MTGTDVDLGWTLEGYGVVIESNLLKMTNVGQNTAIVAAEGLERRRFGALGGRHPWRRVGAGENTADIEGADHCRIAGGKQEFVWTRRLSPRLRCEPMGDLNSDGVSSVDRPSITLGGSSRLLRLVNAVDVVWLPLSGGLASVFVRMDRARLCLVPAVSVLLC